MSNPKHPIITFQLNMTPAWNEQVGPNTNPNTTRVPYPNVATSMNDQNTNVLGDTDQQLPSQTAQYQNQVCTWRKKLRGISGVLSMMWRRGSR